MDLNYNFVGILQRRASQIRCRACKPKPPLPSYTLVDTDGKPKRKRQSTGPFTIKVTCFGLTATGSGLSKKVAKQFAAKNMLAKLDPDETKGESGKETKDVETDDDQWTEDLFVKIVAQTFKEIALTSRETSRYFEEYETVGVLGSGGFGIVLKSRHKLDTKNYAIKRVKLPSTEKEKEKMMREVQHLARLSHENIIRYFTCWKEAHTKSWMKNKDDALGIQGMRKMLTSDGLESTYDGDSDTSLDDDDDEDQGPDQEEVTDEEVAQVDDGTKSDFLFIVMELCKKETLKKWLNTNVEIRDESVCWSYFRQIVQGVRYIHAEGIIHRDLKPANIFFGLKDNNVKIGDFGLAIDNDETTSGASGDPDFKHESHTHYIGTSIYMSPEQVDGKKYDKKVDIYALGIILFELFNPFKTEQERWNEINRLKAGQRQMHPSSLSMFLRMLEKEPVLRPEAEDLLLASIQFMDKKPELNYYEQSFWARFNAS